MAELEKVVEEIKKPFYTIYLGGGNPMLLGVERIKLLLETATKYGSAEECTLEVNPEDVTSSLDTLYPLVTRISTGIQTMSDRTLSFLSRRGSVEENIKAMEYLSHSPFNWNADIVTAIPGTEISDTIYDLESVIKYNPGHISFYCLTFEENTPLIGRACPVGEEKEREFLLSGWKLLKERGYNHYEISAFSRSGSESRHNSLYWELGQYIGLGPSAESFLGYTTGTTMRNTEDLDSFISAPAFNCENLNEKETEESYILTSLRTMKGIDKREYNHRFSFDFDEKYSSQISSLDKAWYVNDKDSFRLTEEGMMIDDTVILILSMVI